MVNLLYSIPSALAGAALLSSVAKPAAPASATDVETTLSKIREVRILEVAAAPPADESFFTMGGETSALSLEFRVSLPRGVTLVSVGDVSRMEATDSTGRNLAPEDLSGALEAEERFEFGDFGEEPEMILDTITLSLELPERAATSFSVNAEADATLATGTKELVVDVTERWQTLAAEDFGGEPVRVRLSGEMSETAALEFTPADAAQRAIESMRINVEGDELAEVGSMSDSRSITYFFDGGIEEGEPAKVTLVLRTGLETVKVRLIAKDQKLP